MGTLSSKPMYLAEYGCDAYNGQTKQEDQNTQSEIISSLTQEILTNASVTENGVCTGGMLLALMTSGGNTMAVVHMYKI